VDRLDGVLEQAQSLGLLGPGPVGRQREHAEDLAAGAGRYAGEFLDLGSGGGVPGLVLLHAWPESSAVLLDAQQRRCEFLQRSAHELGLTERVTVECGRAEDLARRPDLRSRFELVVSRGFGPPPVTAECAVGFLRVGGRLVVTEPPDVGALAERWNEDGLRTLGFGPATHFRSGETGAVSIILADPVGERWPRRDGVPAKRRLW
jgi:16S rRNA (guanine527-N7)-methyltransferase